MLAVAYREFKNLIKSVKSLIVIAIIFGITVGFASLIRFFQEQFQELNLGTNEYATGVLILILLASPLFIFTLSHNIINEELKSRTIRFIATKTSRNQIVLGKFLGVLLFWIVCLTAAFLLIIPYSKAFHFLELLQTIIFVSYYIGLNILFSISISKPGVTAFLGMILSIAIPIIGVWSIGSEKVFLKIYSYITPYFYYSQTNDSYIYIVVIFPILFLVLSIILIRKRDL